MSMEKPMRYVVDADYLPKALRLTAQAKALMANGGADGMDDAIKRVGISRSTFYKYKDGIFALYDLGMTGIINLSIALQHRTGVLSGILNAIAECGGNVLTINQGLPTLNGALVTLSIGMNESKSTLNELVERISTLSGVGEIHIDGYQN